MDFLRSAQAHERLEIYELLTLAEKATAEEIARRDRFWNAVVYFRAQRWKKPSRNSTACGAKATRRTAAAMVSAPSRAAVPEDGDRARATADRSLPVKRTEYPAAIRELIAQLRQMPGVGPRSAERIALWMVQARNRAAGGNRGGDYATRVPRSIPACNAVFSPPLISAKSALMSRAPGNCFVSSSNRPTFCHWKRRAPFAAGITP